MTLIRSSDLTTVETLSLSFGCSPVPIMGEFQNHSKGVTLIVDNRGIRLCTKPGPWYKFIRGRSWYVCYRPDEKLS
jgi:hypothetical protein